MQEVQPDFESIYTPEYWGDIPAIHDLKRSSAIGKALELRKKEPTFEHGKLPTLKAEHEIGEALARTAFDIYNGSSEPLQIEDDVLLGTEDDNTYAIPGNILLLDTEAIYFGQDAQRDPFYGEVRNQFEIKASALQIVKGRFRHITSYTYDPLAQFGEGGPLREAASFLLKPFTEVEPHEEELSPHLRYKPYERELINPEIGKYQRSVDLIAFFNTKKGDATGSRRTYGSFIYDSGDAHSWLGATSHKQGRVGKTINVSIGEDVQCLQRTRSAYLCARGAFESAPAKTKKKSGSKQVSPALSTN